MLDTIQKYLENQCLQPVKKVKNKTASETDLVVIGKNMKKEFNKNQLFQEVETIIIENQISPIANRMKTIQGMLAQYFIMINDGSNIQFISSSNKLKQFVVEGSRTTKSEEIKDIKKTNPNYKEHKKDGIYYFENILKRNENLNSWIDSLDVKKKDDLADAFLQGLWYFKNKNIITYADDLKINSVSLTNIKSVKVSTGDVENSIEKILNNLGLQFTIAITAFAIIYGIGNYVFKTIPGEMLEKRINSL